MGGKLGRGRGVQYDCRKLLLSFHGRGLLAQGFLITHAPLKIP